MKVIGGSWGRTGTTSAGAALEVLGFGACVQLLDAVVGPDLCCDVDSSSAIGGGATA